MNKDPERAAAVKLSGMPPASAYLKTHMGEQALMAGMLSSKKQNLKAASKPVLLGPVWLERTRRTIKRLFDFAETPETVSIDLGLLREFVEGTAASPKIIADNARDIAKTKARYRSRISQSTNVRIPRDPRDHAVIEQRNSIAENLEILARSKADLVNESINFYLSRVYKDNMIVLTKEYDAPKVRRWLELVRYLRLEIRVYGFTIGTAPGQPANLKPMLRLVGLPSNTPIHWRHARNAKSHAAMHHLGLDVVASVPRNGKLVTLSSEAFRSAMTYAAIAGIWLLAREHNANSKPISVQQPEENGSQGSFSFEV